MRQPHAVGERAQLGDAIRRERGDAHGVFASERLAAAEHVLLDCAEVDHEETIAVGRPALGIPGQRGEQRCDAPQLGQVGALGHVGIGARSAHDHARQRDAARPGDLDRERGVVERAEARPGHDRERQVEREREVGERLAIVDGDEQPARALDEDGARLRAQLSRGRHDGLEARLRRAFQTRGHGRGDGRLVAQSRPHDDPRHACADPGRVVVGPGLRRLEHGHAPAALRHRRPRALR